MVTFLVFPLLAFFLLSGFFSISETAFFSSNRYKIRHLASQGNKPAQKLSGWLEKPDRLLATLLLGSNFANIGAATVSAAIVSRFVREPDIVDIALAVDTVFLTIVMLLFCELGPKALAARYPERIGLRVVLPIDICMRLFYPVTKYGLTVAAFFLPRGPQHAGNPQCQRLRRRAARVDQYETARACRYARTGAAVFRTAGERRDGSAHGSDGHRYQHTF